MIVLLFGERKSSSQRLNNLTHKQQSLQTTSKLGSFYRDSSKNKSEEEQYGKWMTFAWVMGGAAFIASNVCWFLGASTVWGIGLALITIVSLLSIPLIKSERDKAAASLNQNEKRLSQSAQQIKARATQVVTKTPKVARIAREYIDSQRNFQAEDSEEDDFEEEVKPAEIDDLKGFQIKIKIKPKR